MTGMDSHGWQELAGVIGMFILVTVVVTVAIWQFAATRRLKAQLAAMAPYRPLAESSVRVQEETSRQLGEVTTRLRETTTRLERLENILKEVE